MQTTEELKKLLYKNETVADVAPETLEAAQKFCEGYKTFLDCGKTEREATAYSEKLLKEAGYKQFVPGENWNPAPRFTPSIVTNAYWRLRSAANRWIRASI